MQRQQLANMTRALEAKLERQKKAVEETTAHLELIQKQMDLLDADPKEKKKPI